MYRTGVGGVVEGERAARGNIKRRTKAISRRGGGAKEGLEEGKYRMAEGGGGARNERASMGVSRSRDDYRLGANP